ncbi:glycoside hydrolase family 48 protein [Stigmatella sp. ncwal1]|uniref:Glycoside hydrolase family 48 protein n=1 Tax=Stigmatella ashevillensis TaxID=2995309 RepID=A0ABT5D987_9BACT|nr:glycoside hydrolase family 48 protein [Stigmatella ashevillena]MDC0709368.1 glycoside hydrolase family 48 protein [Stigmatella ashevillena]
MLLRSIQSAVTQALCLSVAMAVPAQAVAATHKPVPTLAMALAAESPYTQRFLAQYNKIKDPANGYFSPKGVPYHSVETLMVEAPDHGHETTSEAYSYWLWLEAEYGHVTGNWAPFNAAWANMEQYIIPSQADQPSNAFYQPSKPATYAAEWDLPSQYPSVLRTTVAVGSDPIASELQTAYGTSNIYGMHWLLDVDNWYGYGRCGDGTTSPSYINTFQRGSQESVWETVPHPSCDTFAWGKTGQGFLSLFTGDASYSRQWRYTNAPDADARAVQAAYWAYTWAKEQGKEGQVADAAKKAAKMGDYLRYSMFDKYFKRIGECIGETACPAGTGKNSMHYLMSWYYSWGGAMDSSGGWAWRIGSSHNHFGYQNPMAAYILSATSFIRPQSATGVSDWATSLQRQLEFYTWLQSAEGGIAGGATNSWQGRHAQPESTSTFYGMYYDWRPVYHDPASNQWFGFQAWSMQRVAEYYYVTGDAKAKKVLDKWVSWASQNTTLTADGKFQIPSTLQWTGQPDTWNPANPGGNNNLHVKVLDFTQDVGVAAGFARTLVFYAAKSGNAGAKTLAKELLDRMWANYQTPKGVAVAEKREDYKRFDDVYNAATGDGVYVPPGWTGKNAQGAVIDANSTFISLRPKYQQDPDWPKVQAYLAGGAVPEFTYHRFWAQADVAMAMADYGRLLEGGTPVASIVTSSSDVSVPEGATASFTVSLSSAPSSNVTVTVAKASGDADLFVSSGATLTFTPANWNVGQTVTVSAAEDADLTHGTAQFRLTASGFTAVAVNATELDNDLPLPPDCVVTVDTSNDWGSGQVGRVIVQNGGTQPLSNWKVSWTATNDFTLVNTWSATFTKTGRSVEVTPLGGATIPANGQAESGFQASYSGAKPVPSGVRLEGRTCTIVVK